MRVHGRIRYCAFAVLFLFFCQNTGAAQPEAFEGEYVVKLKSANRFRNWSRVGLARSLGARIAKVVPENELVLVRRNTRQTKEEILRSLEANPEVEYVEPHYIYRIQRTPDDSGWSRQWGLDNRGQSDSGGQYGKADVDIDAVRAWDLTQGSSEILVGVVDTGIDYKHPDLSSNIWVNQREAEGLAGRDDDGNGYVDDIYGMNFSVSHQPNSNVMDDHGHGTHVAGVIGAKTNNARGMAGINWHVKIVPLKSMNSQGFGGSLGVIESINYAIKMKIRVLNSSWGGVPHSRVLAEAIERARDAGIVFVAAAGNYGNDNDGQSFYPASYKIENVISVGAADNLGQVPSFSNYGKNSVHLLAPGKSIYSTYPNDSYKSWSGTSMAAPHVAGVAALILSRSPHLNAEQIRDRILKSVRSLPAAQGKTITGGLLNAYGALLAEDTPQ